MNIVFAVDNNGFDMMATALYSVIKNNQSHELCFYVFHKSISNTNTARLKKLERKFSNVTISTVPINEGRFVDVQVSNKNVTTEAFFRYLAPEFLKKEARALYLDFDMLCLADLGGLYETELEANYLGAVADYVVEHNPNFRNFKKGIGYDDSDTYANSGLLLFNLDKMRDSGVMDEFWKNVHNKNKIIAKEFNIFADQTVMNLTFKGRIKFLSPHYNTFTTVLEETRQKNPAIVHFTGPYKPLTYRNDYTAIYDEEYFAYNRECVEVIGGDESLLAKNMLKKLSKESANLTEVLEVERRALASRTEQFVDAQARIGELERVVAQQQALIQDERRIKSALKNLVKGLRRRLKIL